jgi:hypothetical protein
MDNNSFDRRTFLLNTAASGFALSTVGRALAAPIVTGPVVARPVDVDMFRPIKMCRIRKHISSLTPAELAALKTGVAAMQARPASDPTSWSYQAAIHGTYTTPTKPLWNQCQHGSIHFFSWHRLYLYYFERILRAASGSSSLTLPYWNWTASRALPAAFRDSTPGNPLYTTHRGSGINGGALLPASAVSYASSFANVPFAAFSGDLEGTPHGSVHVSIGGWMGQVPTAGQDPIFYLHHCNIDRLWEKWLAQGGGRANPSDPAWKNQSFSFFDETGTQRTRKAGDALSICPGLQYTYAKERILVLSPAILALLLSYAEIAKLKPRVTISADAAAALGMRPAALKLPLDKAKAAIESGGRVLLSFDDIKIANPEGYYEIYLNPASSKVDFTDPSYAGNLVTFGLTAAEQAVKHGDMKGMDAMPPRRVFDITRSVTQMRDKKNLGDTLNVVLMLRLPDGVRADDKPRGQIGKVSLLVE